MAAEQTMAIQDAAVKARARLESLQQYLDRCRVSGTLHPLQREIESTLNETMRLLESPASEGSIHAR
jgi:hypothetical protein